MFHPGHCASRGRNFVLPQRRMGGSMKNFKLATLVLAGMVLSNVVFSQQPQPAQPQPAQTQPVQTQPVQTQPAQPQPVQPALKAQEHAANLDVGNTPTRNDMYCSGFL